MAYPIRILVVDDDPGRQLALQHSLVDETLLTGSCTVESTGCSDEAKEKLRGSRYDLVVIDLVLPTTKNSVATDQGGVDLAEWLLTGLGHGPMIPQAVIALSKSETAISNFDSRFALHGWRGLAADSSNSWVSHVSQQVRQLVMGRQLESMRRADVLVLTALQDPEGNAVRQHAGLEFRASPSRSSALVAEMALLRTSDERCLRVALASQVRMGPYDAGVRAAHLVRELQPGLVVMPGICASLRRRVSLGTVCVADSFFDWDSGKYIQRGKAWGRFEPRPAPLGTNKALLTTIGKSQVEPTFGLEVLRRAGLSSKPDLRVEVGPFATGTSVVADTNVRRRIRRTVPHALALEMEGYALALACEASPEPQPRFLVAKVAVDFADGKKSDEWHERGARVSAAFCIEYVKRFAGALGI